MSIISYKFCYALFGFLLLITICWGPVKAAQNVSHSISQKVIKAFEKRAKTYFLKSVVPVNNFVPISTFNDNNQLYREFYKEEYPNLFPALQLDTNPNPYAIRQFSDKLAVYLGYPEFLKPRISASKSAGSDELNLLKKTIEANKLGSFFTIADTAKKADIYILPVASQTVLEPVHPNIKRRLNISKTPYTNIYTIMNTVFPNIYHYKLNESGIKGAFVTDKNGMIRKAFCPMDFDKKDTLVRKTLRNCLIQSNGLPGFSRHITDGHIDIGFWGRVILRLKNCMADGGAMHFFQKKLTHNFFLTCLKQEDFNDAHQLFR